MTTATVKRNPKQEGTNIFDCKPQVGLAPSAVINVSIAPAADSYTSIYEDLVPTPEDPQVRALDVQSCPTHFSHP